MNTYMIADYVSPADISTHLSGLNSSGFSQYSSSLCNAQTLACIAIPAGNTMSL